MKILVAYYSRTGENYVQGSILDMKKGNTAILAERIADQTKGTLFEIRQKKEYSHNYEACTQEAKEDMIKNARPELVSFPEGIDTYEVIFLGYPNYWGTCPMAVFTFLEQANLKNKKIIPFCTHEGSGFGNSFSDLLKATQGNELLEGISIYGSVVNQAQKEIDQWLSMLKL